MLIRPILGAALLLLLSPAADAQWKGVPKSPSPPAGPTPRPHPESKGGPLDPEKVRKKSDLQDRRVDDSTGPPAATVGAGAVVEGRGRKDAVHQIRFEAPRGARLGLELTVRDSTAAATGVLRGPASEEIATLAPVKGRDGTCELKDLELDRSGLFTLDVSLKGATADFRLETHLEIPSRQEDELEWRDGRPHRLLLGGMKGRSVQDLTVRAKDRSDGLDFNARLFDPDGFPVDLEPHLKRTSGSGVLTLRDLPLGIAGDYELFVADTSRNTGEATITIRFDNPPESKERVRL